MVNKPLIRPAISGGGYVARGGRLTSHDYKSLLNKKQLSWQITTWMSQEVTPPKTNMEPENTPLEKEKHLQTTNFWVPC